MGENNICEKCGDMLVNKLIGDEYHLICVDCSFYVP